MTAPEKNEKENPEQKEAAEQTPPAVIPDEDLNDLAGGVRVVKTLT
jgi:hypothetical protein